MTLKMGKKKKKEKCEESVKKRDVTGADGLALPSVFLNAFFC